MSITPGKGTEIQEIEIDYFRNEDAPGVARLFREVYGEGYPIRTYYLPDRLIEENAAGRIISSVARTQTGEIAGHNALILVDSDSRFYENAAGAVLSTFRGHRIFPRLFRHSIVDVSKRFGVEAIIGEPVCSHPHLQKMCLEIGFTELGLEVDLMPAAAYTTDPNVSGRVSVLQGCFMYKPAAQTAHIPQVYRNELEFLYSEIKGERTFIHSATGLPADGSSRASVNLFDLAQVARISIDSIGSDFESFIARTENEARGKGIQVFQVWLPLASLFVPAAADILRAQGYFLGAMLPCLPKGDGLLMQKLSHEPDWEGMVLYSERAKKIAEMVKRDWECVTKRIKPCLS
ncbi:MAG: hypothetical protein AB9866_08135 [Syntrophobacteraceae bacterium]